MCYGLLVVPAIIVGALTACYLGLRAGIIVAIATAVALLVATFVPGLTITVYALVIGWAAALYFFGPKLAKAAGKPSIGTSVTTATAWAKRLFESRR
jgi:hypothetical protein